MCERVLVWKERQYGVMSLRFIGTNSRGRIARRNLAAMGRISPKELSKRSSELFRSRQKGLGIRYKVSHCIRGDDPGAHDRN